MSTDNTSFQISTYIATNLSEVLYGVELVLYFKTMQLLLGNSGKRKRSDLFYAFFSTMMLFLISIWLVTQVIFNERMWIEFRDYPGGPGQYWADHISDWYTDFGSTAQIMLQLMTDALMIYRCRIVWNSYRIIIVPSILWVATLALGVALDWVSSSPGGDLFSGLASRLGMAYYSTTVFLNAAVTGIICYRMVYHAMKLKKHLGHEHASGYFNVVSVIVESVLPYSLSGIAFLISFGTGSESSMTFYFLYICGMCISPQMLILRVIKGRAWDKDAGERQGTSIKFSPDSVGPSRILDESATSVRLQVLSRVYLADNENKV
ncbi:hypothetical protein BDN67DRAFT_1010570 [Paxillus ammoniavirescens]|nr:hypothetical protein BDN67DRAFT_1010570 [Paxillus ammoniavirescens]